MLKEYNQGTMSSTMGVFWMRRLVLLIVALSAMSGYALAHTPAGVEVSYDENSGDLMVAITHQVDDPATHYVKHVTVRQGNTVLIDTSYTSQPDKSSFLYRYNLPQLKGSSGEIRVDAGCNLIGSRSGTLLMTVTPAPGSPDSPVPAPTRAPGFAVIPLLAIGLAATRIMR